jgi:hypothetical protein
MHISSIFYSARFKAILRDLRAKDHLREEPLGRLDKTVYINLLIALVAAMLICFYGREISYLLIFAFLFMAIFAVWVDIRERIKKIIIPCSVGYLVPMDLETEPEYKNISYMERAWVFRYSIFLQDDQWISDCVGPYLEKKLLDMDSFNALPKLAFVDPENVKNNCPYIEEVVDRYRVSNQKVDIEPWVNSYRA